MPYKYSMQKFDKEHMARTVGVALPISTKQSIEICNHIRNKNVESAKKILQDAIEKKKAIPFRRFNNDVGHKPGMAAGRYPVKACSRILELVNTAEANAQFKGLNTSLLTITHINAQNASRPWRYGRQRRRQSKRCHIEIVVQEMPEEKKAKKVKKGKEGSSKEKAREQKPTVNKKTETNKEIPEKPARKEEPKEEKKTGESKPTVSGSSQTKEPKKPEQQEKPEKPEAQAKGAEQK
ncbi:50S ribosomal protein L22 [Candidatus Woesearchaeota archaeon]|nr:50S ribosomal protein L22 [Candidatus Woesearchaeota archaeon]